MSGGLHRLKQVLPHIDLVIDVGAAEGWFLKKAKAVYPAAASMVIEPLEVYESLWSGRQQEDATLRYHRCAAGSNNGVVQMFVSEDLVGSGIYENEGDGNLVVTPLRRLDGLVEASGSMLLKLDTHGYEVPVLDGCSAIWNYISVVIIEVYNFKFTPNAVMLPQMLMLMENKGFRLFDLVDLLRRPDDAALWQADAVFLPKNHPVFNNESYIADNTSKSHNAFALG